MAETDSPVEEDGGTVSKTVRPFAVIFVVPKVLNDILMGFNILDETGMRVNWGEPLFKWFTYC